MQKHAYLILAHHQFGLLEELLRLLDDERNDIFIHIDRKVKGLEKAQFKRVCQRAGVYFSDRRVNVRWGHHSQVDAEMALLRTAYGRGAYRYYHLLSGVDLPLHSQDYIHTRLASETASFLEYTDTPSVWDVRRISRYHNVFPKWLPGYKRWNAMFAAAQERAQVDRLKGTGLTVQKGANWASLNHEAVEQLVKNRALIGRITRFSLCADEVYKQTLLMARGCKVTGGNLRLILWKEENHPETLTMEHWPLLRDSEKLFARKFDPSVDEKVIRNIIRKVRDEENGEHRAAGV